jgi:hypothetical protein
MALFPLKLPPGTLRNGTRYQARDRWHDAQLIRFLEGTIRPLGGWERLQANDADLVTNSSGVLTLTLIPSDTETVTIDARVYTFQTVLTDVDGNVLIGATASASIDNLVAAIGLGAGSGTLYAASTTLHATASAIAGENDTMYVEAKTVGDQALATTETLSGGSWDSTTLEANRTRAIIGWQDDAAGVNYVGIGTNAKIYTFTQGIRTDRTPDDLVTGGIDTTITTGAYGQGAYGAGGYGSGDPAQGVSTEAACWSLDTFGDFLVGVLNPSDGTLWKFDPATDTYMTGVGGAPTGTLTLAGNAADTETVTMDGKVYTFQTVLTDVDGNVLIGAAATDSIDNLIAAINLGAGGGSTYAASTTLHPSMTAAVGAGDTMVATAKASGDSSLLLATTETLATAGSAWAAAVLTHTRPIDNVGLVVTEDRFLFALGADGNPRQVRWPDQESLTDWTATSANQAGNLILAGEGIIMTGRRGRKETLVWTDQDLWAFRFIGGTLVYGKEQIGTNCGIISRKAVAGLGGKWIWMGHRGFFIYDGQVRDLPSDVSDDIFKDFNRAQRHKCWATSLHAFGEVIFFYPSGGSAEPNRYVIYNHRERHWTNGSMTRLSGMDIGPLEYPMMADQTYVYDHERGTAHAGAATPFLDSGPMEIGNGDQIVMVRQVYPDEATLAGQQLGNVDVRFFTAFYPSETELTQGPFTLANPTPTRFSARQTRVRFTEILAGDWRIGIVRLEGEKGGLR